MTEDPSHAPAGVCTQSDWHIVTDAVTALTVSPSSTPPAQLKGMRHGSDVPQTSSRCCRTWSWAARPRRWGCSRWGRRRASGACERDPANQQRLLISRLLAPVSAMVSKKLYPSPKIHYIYHEWMFADTAQFSFFFFFVNPPSKCHVLRK